MTEETFGPTLPVMAVAGEEEAVALVNDSPMGLGAAVFARSAAEGERVARRLRAGAVCVNDAAVNYFALEAPMGGLGESGIGVRHGPEGIRKYCTQRTILVTPRGAPRREPQFYPHTRAPRAWCARCSGCSTAAENGSQMTGPPGSDPRSAGGPREETGRSLPPAAAMAARLGPAPQP